MCGLVGWITNSKVHSEERRKWLRSALIADTLRGEDSTGIFMVYHEHEKNETSWLKDVSDGYAFTDCADYAKFTNNLKDVRAVVGHNRSATKGGLTVDAAHPFQEGPITLVHNGTLIDTDHHEISEDDEGVHNDSHSICHNLALAEPGGKEVIEKLYGAFALIWHDARDDKIRIVRNKERPLHFALSESKYGGDTLYFASEAGMLAWLLSRHKIPHGVIQSPKPGKLLTFGGDCSKPQVEDVEVDSYIPDWYGYGKYGGSYWPEKNVAGFTSQPGKEYGVPKPSESGSPADNRVVVLGRKMDVPVPMQEELMEWLLSVEDRITFVPRKAQPTTHNNQVRHTVQGNLVNRSEPTYDGMTAVIHGLPQSIWSNHSSVLWTVRPVGIKYVEGKPLVICKLCSYSAARGGTTISVADWDKKQSETNLPAVVYQGAGGRWVDLQTWAKQTSQGCGQCTGNLFASDHQKIEWVNDRQTPICWDCQEDNAEFLEGLM